MSISTVQFISQVKLEELRRQRAILVDAYDTLWANCQQKTPQDALISLYVGLADIQIGGTPLHAELGDIEILIRSDNPSQEIISFWRKRLETDWGKGRLRADIVYLFGALLGEWGSDDPARREFLLERQKVHNTLLSVATTGSPRNQHQTLFQELLAPFASRLDELNDKIEAKRKALYQGNTECDVNLDSIAKNFYQPSAVRSEANRFSEDNVLQSQLREALRIASRDVLNWQWPAEGIESRAVWTRNKWRLCLSQSLVEICLADCFSNFWGQAIEQNFCDSIQKINRLRRLNKLLDLDAPSVIIDNEERMLRDLEGRLDLGWYEKIDPWDGSQVIPSDRKTGGIIAIRAESQGGLRQNSTGYYGYDANAMVHLVHVEVQTLRKAFPEKPLFIAKLDLRDYFASIPHDVLISMVRSLGLNEVGAQAIRRFLEVPFLKESKVVPAARGVPMQQQLSHWLAEWLLRLMERYVHERASVRIIRQVDDICLLTPRSEQLRAAWNAVHEFVRACGLQINSEKCGLLAIGEELNDLEGVPRNDPRWGLLELTAEGEWRVHEPSFQSFLTETRRHATARHAILSKVTFYNSHLKFLTSALGLSLDLGETHRRSVNHAMQRFDSDFFEPGLGIVAGLQREIQLRYLLETQLSDLPESWMYWPITAGGLSLQSSLVLCGQYQAAFLERQKKQVQAPSVRVENWQRGSKEWTAFYTHLLTRLEPTKPIESVVMKSLVDDFIARGQEISGGKQTGLTDYWRWILSIYGPEIVERFGTFRFLLTDLVPLQLIRERLLHASSLDNV